MFLWYIVSQLAMFDSMFNETGGYSHNDLIAAPSEPSQPLASCRQCRPAQELAQAPFVLVLCRIPNIFLPSLRHGRKCLRHPARCYWCGWKRTRVSHVRKMLEVHKTQTCFTRSHIQSNLVRTNMHKYAQICTKQWFSSKVLPPRKEHFPHICALAHELKTLQLTMRHPLIAACANFHPVFLENTHSCSIYVSFDLRELDSYLTYLL